MRIILIPNQLVETNIKYCRRNVKDHYQNLGYDIADGIITVKAEDLWPESHTKVLVQCDYCQNQVDEIDYRDYYRSIHKSVISKYACHACILTKRREGNLKKYGVPEFLSRPEIQERKKQTCIEKYGGPSPMYSDDVKEKHKQHFIDKYGVENPSQVAEFQVKKAQTKYLNGTCNDSKEQRRLAELFQGELNYPIGPYNVDILLEDKIILEYDGDGHQIHVKYHLKSLEEFEVEQTKRTNLLLAQGYRIIRFINLKWWEFITDEEYITAMKLCKEKLNAQNIVSYDFNNQCLK